MAPTTGVCDFEKNGFAIIKGFVTNSACDTLRTELEVAIENSLNMLGDVVDAGMVHNCFIHGPSMRGILDNELLRDYTDQLLCKNAIVYAYQSSSLAPGKGNYGSRIHVDSPRFIPGYRTNLGFILALDDFTEENGATWVMPGSHKNALPPANDAWQRDAVQLLCSAGDAVFFDARLYHAAGENQTADWRHALTINFCRPYMRTRFDFPRLAKTLEIESLLSNAAKKYLGYDVRVPTSLDEFYLPVEQRLYAPNQE